MNWQIEDKKTY